MDRPFEGNGKNNLPRHEPGSPPLFEGLNFEVAQGEKVLLVGPNGSGKTTLLHLLAGLLESCGLRYQAFWAGKPVRLQEIRSEIAYAPSEDYLFDELTAEEHIEVFRARACSSRTDRRRPFGWTASSIFERSCDVVLLPPESMHGEGIGPHEESFRFLTYSTFRSS